MRLVVFLALMLQFLADVGATPVELQFRFGDKLTIYKSDTTQLQTVARSQSEVGAQEGQNEITYKLNKDGPDFFKKAIATALSATSHKSDHCIRKNIILVVDKKIVLACIESKVAPTPGLLSLVRALEASYQISTATKK